MASNEKSKVVLITGAGRGLGRALALAFVEAGARVAANDLTPINLDETVSMAREKAQNGGEIQDFLADVSSKMAVQGMVMEILDRWGRLDVLVNNAGVRPRIALLDMDEWDWRRTVDVNLGGVFIMTQVCGRVMRELGGGVVINIGDAGLPLPDGKPQAAYLASKAGMLGLSEAAEAELAHFGIKVWAVTPGLLDSESTREMFPVEAGEQFGGAIKMTNLDEVVETVMGLAGLG